MSERGRVQGELARRGVSSRSGEDATCLTFDPSPSHQLLEQTGSIATGTSVAMARRVTGLQRQIYTMYKRSLKMVGSKPLVRFRSQLSSSCCPASLLFRPDMMHEQLKRSHKLTNIPHSQASRPSWYAFVSHQFRHPTLGGGLKKKDVGAIEYYLRRGEKMLEMYEKDGVKNVSVPDGEEGRWEMGWVAKGGKEGAEERRRKEEV